MYHCASPIVYLVVMSFHVKSFVPKYNNEDPLGVCSIVKNVDDKFILLAKGNAGTYLPNVWSDVVTRDFTHSPQYYIRDNWTDLSNLKSIEEVYSKEVQAFVKTLSPEQCFIVDNISKQISKSGISIVSVALSSNKIAYNLLGDAFLFFYNKEQNKLRAYCSMIDTNGKFDFAQPCHGLYSDLTLLGDVLSGECKVKGNDIVLVMTRDLADWFIQSSTSGLYETVETILSIHDSNEFEKFIRQVYSKQTYKGVPFDKDISTCIVIEHVCDGKFEVIKRKALNLFKNNKIIIAILTILLGLSFMIKKCSHTLSNENQALKNSQTEQFSK